MLRGDTVVRDNARCLYVCGSMAHIAIYEPPHDKTNKMSPKSPGAKTLPEHSLHDCETSSVIVTFPEAS